MNAITEHGVYWLCIALMMTGLYIVISRDHLVKKIMGLNLFQVSVILFYVSVGKVKGGTAPILNRAKASGRKSIPGRTISTVRMPGSTPIRRKPRA